MEETWTWNYVELRYMYLLVAPLSLTKISCEVIVIGISQARNILHYHATMPLQALRTVAKPQVSAKCFDQSPSQLT